MRTDQTNNAFPIEAFPEMFQDLISQCQKALNFPTDYTGASILTAVSTAIGTSAKIKVKNGWEEFASLYMAIVGSPGANKSHPLSTIFSSFHDLDRIAIKEFEVRYDEFEEYQNLSVKEKKQGTSSVPQPKLVKHILNNFTPEILHLRLQDNQRGCAVVSDELASFLEGMNNYSRGDQAGIYLSFWNNKPTSIDRVSKPVPLLISNPFLTIVGTLQPRCLKKVFPDNRIDNGLLQRFLIAFPDAMEKLPINDNELPSDILVHFHKFLQNYISSNPIQTDPETGKILPNIFEWNKEAKEYFYQWHNRHTIEVNENQNNVKGELISKFDIHFVRIALILQIMEDSNTKEISLNAVKGAEALCRYFQTNAFKVIDIINSDPKDGLQANKRVLYDSLPNEFTTAVANEIGQRLGLNEKLVQRFILDRILFNKLAHGSYSKANAPTSL